MGEKTEGVDVQTAAEESERDVNKVVFDDLQQAIPEKFKSDLPAEEKNADQSILNLNKEASETILGILKKNESARIKQQKPLQVALLVFVGLQLLFFNGIIGFLVWQLRPLAEIEVITSVLDFLKYYIGAVVVELISMLVFITKSTFTSPSHDIIKGFFSKNSK